MMSYCNDGFFSWVCKSDRRAAETLARDECTATIEKLLLKNVRPYVNQKGTARGAFGKKGEKEMAKTFSHQTDLCLEY